MARVPAGVTVRGKMLPEYRAIITPEALGFLAALHRNFDGERQRLLAKREARAKLFDKGELPDFLPETRAIREGTWRVAPIPADLQDRRVEITGPTDRKMVINALNSGAKVFMADFEDSTSPVLDNLIRGQINLRDRWSGAMDHRDKDTEERQRRRSRSLSPNPHTRSSHNRSSLVLIIAVLVAIIFYHERAV